MLVCEFATELYGKLTAALEVLDDNELPQVQRHEEAVSVLYDYLQQLKDFTRNYTFADTAEEVRFFKQVKPKFTCLLVFHMTAYNIETEKPIGPNNVIKEYYGKELEKVQYYFEDNFDFHKYYRAGACHLDDKYFMRGNFDIHLTKGAFIFDLDSSFSTLCDYKVAKIMANEMLVDHLNKKLQGMELGETEACKTSAASKFNLAWTASKTDFIELLYGLYCIGAFNNGSVELNKVMTVFAISFGIDFGNYSRYLQQMRIRKKNRTSFIDKIKDKLINYMDELDDQLDNRL